MLFLPKPFTHIPDTLRGSCFALPTPQVLASEIQEDLHHAASELTQRAVDANGGALSVQHLLGDFIEVAKRLPHNYDHIMSWLTVCVCVCVCMCVCVCVCVRV